MTIAVQDSLNFSSAESVPKFGLCRSGFVVESEVHTCVQSSTEKAAPPTIRSRMIGGVHSSARHLLAAVKELDLSTWCTRAIDLHCRLRDVPNERAALGILQPRLPRFRKISAASSSKSMRPLGKVHMERHRFPREFVQRTLRREKKAPRSRWNDLYLRTTIVLHFQSKRPLVFDGTV